MAITALVLKPRRVTSSLEVDHKDLSDSYVQLLLERFDSYAEYSVSGSGVHIYGKCDIS